MMMMDAKNMKLLPTALPSPTETGRNFTETPKSSSSSSSHNFFPRTPHDQLGGGFGEDGGTPIQRRYRKGEVIGRGANGVVYQGMDTQSGGLVTVKEVPSGGNDANFAKLKSEVELMSRLSHQHIVTYYGAELDEANCVLLIYQEWVPGGSVDSLLLKFGGRFTDDVTRRYAVHVAKGLAYLHEHLVVHRDVKGGNVLVTDHGVAKLSDFGTSLMLADSTAASGYRALCGTPYFMAPEVMKGETYGRKADVWSYGGLLLQMATGQPPWKTKNFQSIPQLMLHVVTVRKPPPIPEDLSPSLVKLILRCFQFDASKRPTIQQLLKENDSFLSSQQSDGVLLPRRQSSVDKQLYDIEDDDDDVVNCGDREDEEDEEDTLLLLRQESQRHLRRSTSSSLRQPPPPPPVSASWTGPRPFPTKKTNPYGRSASRSATSSCSNSPMSNTSSLRIFQPQSGPGRLQRSKHRVAASSPSALGGIRHSANDLFVDQDDDDDLVHVRPLRRSSNSSSALSSFQKKPPKKPSPKKTDRISFASEQDAFDDLATNISDDDTDSTCDSEEKDVSSSSRQPQRTNPFATKTNHLAVDRQAAPRDVMAGPIATTSPRNAPVFRPQEEGLFRESLVNAQMYAADLEDDDADDPQTITIEDAFERGYIDAAEYYSRIRQIDTDPDLALYKIITAAAKTS